MIGLLRGRPQVLLAVLALAAAAPYLRGGPVWDDHTLIAGALADVDLRALWTSPVGGGEVGGGYYRPLAMSALALLSRLGWWAIHLAAAALHVGSTLLLWDLFSSEVRPHPARLGAGVFAVHPLASEVLGWCSALPDALAVHAGLWSIALSWTTPVGVALAVFAGALCKETAVLLLPFGVAAGLAPRRALLPWGGALAAVALMRLSSGTGAAWSLAGKSDLALVALGWPAVSLVIPWPLTAVRDLLAAPAWVGPTGLALLAVALWWGRRAPLALAGAGLVIASAALALPPTLHGYLAAERYAYPALVGLAAWVAACGPARRSLALPLVAALGISLHVLRAPDWRGDVPLFSRATEVLPGSSYAWHFLGMAHRHAGAHDAAAAALVRAVETGHPHPLDRLLALESLVLAGEPRRALEWAEAGPRDGLTADTVAWWGRAARDAGQLDVARQRVAMLAREGGWDGPRWVPALAAELGLSGAR